MSAVISPSTSGGLCHTCDTCLPLGMPLADREETIWLCAKCGFPLAARCLDNELVDLADRIRLHRSNFDTNELPPISSTLRRQIVSMTGLDPPAEFSECRRSPRFPKSVVVPAIRIGDDGNPKGQPLNVLVVNLSAEGVGLVHSDRFIEKRLAIEFPSTGEEYPIQMVVRIVRHRSLTYPFFEVGGEFLLRLGATKTRRGKLAADCLPKM